MQCPMCRTRLSNWVRKQAKTNSLVNQKRWDKIRSLYPERCQKRLNGEDDVDDAYTEYNGM